MFCTVLLAIIIRVRICVTLGDEKCFCCKERLVQRPKTISQSLNRFGFFSFVFRFFSAEHHVNRIWLTGTYRNCFVYKLRMMAITFTQWFHVPANSLFVVTIRTITVPLTHDVTMSIRLLEITLFYNYIRSFQFCLSAVSRLNVTTGAHCNENVFLENNAPTVTEMYTKGRTRIQYLANRTLHFT